MSIWGNVILGIGTSLLGRSSSNRQATQDREIARMQIQAEKENIGLTAAEQRRNQREQALLEEWMRQNRRSERARGLKNYSQFAGSMPAGYQTLASPVLRQVTPDEFINSGGIISNLPAAQQAPSSPGSSPPPGVNSADPALINFYRNPGSWSMP